MAKEKENATVNNQAAENNAANSPAPEGNQENNTPAENQQGNNPAPQPEQLDPPKEGIVRRIKGWFGRHKKGVTAAAAGAGILLTGYGAYKFGHLVGHNEGMLDAYASDDDTQLGIEDKSSYDDVDVDISDVDTDISTIDI